MRLSFQVDLLKSLKIKIKILESFNKDCPKKCYKGILKEFLFGVSLRIFIKELSRVFIKDLPKDFCKGNP